MFSAFPRALVLCLSPRSWLRRARSTRVASAYTSTQCWAGSRHIWAGSRERARAHAPPRPRPPTTSTHHQHPLQLRAQPLSPLRQAQRRPLHMLSPRLWRCSQPKTASTQLALPATSVPSRRTTRYVVPPRAVTRVPPRALHGDRCSGAGAMVAHGPISPRALTPPSIICPRVHLWPTPDRRTPVLR